jgi:hypothetical protein
MQSVLLGRSCGRDGYILGQALHMLESFTGRTLENLTAVVKIKGIRQDVGKVVAAAIGEHLGEVAEEAELTGEARAAQLIRPT